LTAHQPIVFGSVLTNVGNYYNNTTGVFYVPIDGTYQFFVNILSEADNFIETELVVNGTGVAEIYSGAGKYNGAGSNLVIVRLHRGDKVWVKVHYGFSSDMSVHCCWSTFSGVLLRVVADLNQIVG
jgi:plastocyanin domain-containing protein